MSAKIAEDKTYATAWGAYYCEEVIFIPDAEYVRNAIQSGSHNDKASRLKVDVPKMRNFSREVKTQIGG
jgi:hypothetical protein